MARNSTTRSSLCSSPVTTIVEKVADRENVDATELQPPLYDVINPDALNELFTPTERGIPRENGRISFEYCGYDVQVHGDGEVVVEDEAQTTASTEETAQQL